MKKAIALYLIFFAHAIFAQGLPEKIQALLEDFKEKNGIGAISLVLSFSNEAAPQIFNSGTLSEEDNTPVQRDNLFQIGSITKSFIAACILKLQEQEILSVDDSLSQWLPEYAHYGDIRIRNLLNHTSGIFNYTDSDQFKMYLLENPTKETAADKLIHFAPPELSYFHPGEGWHYSNTGYLLLGKILEKATGKTAQTVINELLLNKADYNLVNTAFITHQYPTSIGKRMVHGYYTFGIHHRVDITNFSMSWMGAAGGMVSNGYDLVHWIRALFTEKILNEKSFQAFTHLVSVQNGQPLEVLEEPDSAAYGLGIQAYKTHFESIGIIWWHSGSTLGYKSLMMWLPNQQIAVSITYNQTIAGQENIPFSPGTEFAQKLLFLLQ